MVKVNEENRNRLKTLFEQSHTWLIACAYNISGDKESAEDLVGDLYCYLGEKCNPAIWWGSSFNLMYCHSFLKTRWINRIKINNRVTGLSENWDTTEEEYNVEFDERVEKAYDEVVEELKNMEKTRIWASSKLAQMYFFTEDMTLEKLANEIKISKSTAFLNVKKAKKHLKQKLSNPFRDN